MKKRQHTSGFTLVEMIIAVSVIALVITSVTQLTVSSLQSGRSALDEFVAYHLAEEGLEVIRTIRDSNWMQNRAWRAGLEDGIYTAYERQVGKPWRLQRASLDASRFIEIKTAPELASAIHVRSVVKYGARSVELVAEFTDWKKGPL